MVEKTPRLTIFDPKKISVIVDSKGESHTLDGFAEGTFINIERESDSSTDTIGADGLVTMVYTNDFRGTITFTLKQSSYSNKKMIQLQNAFESKDKDKRKGIFDVSIRDHNGIENTTSKDSWVIKPAPRSYSDKGDTRQYAIKCVELKMDLADRSK